MTYSVVRYISIIPEFRYVKSENERFLYMPQLDTVGQRVNYIRTQLGLSLEALADRAGMSKSFLWEVEQDRSDISGRRLLLLADALNASVEFLLRGGAAPTEHEMQSIEVPRSLGELAEEEGLTYRQMMTILEIENSIVARRGGGPRGTKGKEDWRALYQAVKPFLEEPK